MRGRRRTPGCPVCGAPDARTIVYGLPVADLLDDPDVVLAGCVVLAPAPAFACRNPGCKAEFSALR